MTGAKPALEFTEIGQLVDVAGHRHISLINNLLATPGHGHIGRGSNRNSGVQDILSGMWGA